MKILNQPHEGRLGDLIIENLQSGKYRSFIMVAAYAKMSGVGNLQTSIETFKSKGGNVRAFIGIDQKNTSYEAVVRLQQLCHELYIVHNRNQSHTFHQKIYIFQSNSTAWVSIGSNNLTGGGLWINYETCMYYDYNLTCHEDGIEFEKLLKLLNKYSSDKYKCSEKINSVEDIDRLKERYLPIEKEFKFSRLLKTGSPHTEFFGTESFKGPKTANIPILIKPHRKGSNEIRGTKFIRMQKSFIKTEEDVTKKLIKEYFQDRYSNLEKCNELRVESNKEQQIINRSKKITNSIISRVIQQLPPIKQDFLSCKYCEKLLYTEIVERMGILELTLQRWNRAFKKLVSIELLENSNYNNLFIGYDTLDEYNRELESDIEFFEIFGDLGNREILEKCKNRKLNIEKFIEVFYSVFNESTEKRKKIIELEFKVGLKYVDLNHEKIAERCGCARSLVTTDINNFKKNVLKRLKRLS